MVPVLGGMVPLDWVFEDQPEDSRCVTGTSDH
jgi:hypothetical protein